MGVSNARRAHVCPLFSQSQCEGQLTAFAAGAYKARHSCTCRSAMASVLVDQLPYPMYVRTTVLAMAEGWIVL